MCEEMPLQGVLDHVDSMIANHNLWPPDEAEWRKLLSWWYRIGQQLVRDGIEDQKELKRLYALDTAQRHGDG